MELSPDIKTPLVEYLLRLGDDRLVLGHRISEWCGHAPILEEDIALANIALDCIGQATAFLSLAGEVEGKGRDADALAYTRDAREFRNAQLVEQPNGDFGFTIVRQFLFSTFAQNLYTELSKSSFPELAALAAKGLKENSYHVRHSGEWLCRLGDGTEESHARAQKSIDELWRFSHELFVSDNIDEALSAKGIAPKLETLKPAWEKFVFGIIARATLRVPAEAGYLVTGSRRGIHSEHLGHMLSEMQILPRSFPGATW